MEQKTQKARRQKTLISKSSPLPKNIVAASNLFKIPYQERDFLLQGLLPKGVLAALVGTSDVGKSMFIRDFALHIVLGRPTFLGRKVSSVHKKVLYVSTEDDRNEWQIRLQKSICDQHEGDLLEGLHIMFSQGRETYENILDYLKNNLIDLLVIDVATDLAVGNINDTDAVRAFLNPYKTLAREYGVTVVFVHHTAKRTQGIDKDNTIGSQAWTSTPRAVLMLSKDNSGYGTGSRRFLTLVKGNFASDSEKNCPICLKINDRLSFQEVLSTSGITGLSFNQGKQKNRKDNPAIIEEVSILYSQKKTLEEMVKHFKSKEIKIGKTTIHNIISRLKEQL